MNSSLIELKRDVSISLMHLVADLNSAHSKLAIGEVLQRIRTKSMIYLATYDNVINEEDKKE